MSHGFAYFCRLSMAGVSLLCSLFIPAIVAAPLPELNYFIRPSADLQALDVEICFDDVAPDSLINRDPDAAKNLLSFSTFTRDKKRQPGKVGPILDLSNAQLPYCATYLLGFDNVRSHPWFEQRPATSDQVMLKLNHLLWYPQAREKYRINLIFDLEKGIQVSAPGKRLTSTTDRVVFQLRNRPADWQGRVAIGRFKTAALTYPSGNVYVAVMNGLPGLTEDEIVSWVDANVRALLSAYGRLPMDSLQILVIPVGPDREPVPWGQVLRGGGDAVHLYIDQMRPLTEFMDDWVLSHELSHLLHPRIAGNGSWLAEGLASYYQNVLRARTDLLSPQSAWNKLNAGFERGRRGTPPDRTLNEVTETMMRDRLFMRVYWSGAAISLMADSRLRARPQASSLDRVLDKFSACCLPADREWDVQELLNTWDELSQSRIFTDLYQQHVNSKQFPDLDSTYQMLGLVNTNKGLEFERTAPHTLIRQHIMQVTP